MSMIKEEKITKGNVFTRGGRNKSKNLQFQESSQPTSNNFELFREFN